MVMRSSIAVRLGRASLGLVAIWCLGCTSFDVLVDFLLAGSRPSSVECAMDGAQNPGQSQVAATDASANLSAFDSCGCEHCIADQVSQTETQVARHETPDAPQARLGAELSNALEPLVPPPIVHAIA